MIDMHMHTTYSDGADSLIEVLKKAESLKLEYISITDHDTCEGYKELAKLDVKKYFSGQIINGVEIKCAYKKRLIEIHLFMISCFCCSLIFEIALFKMVKSVKSSFLTAIPSLKVSSNLALIFNCPI